MNCDLFQAAMAEAEDPGKLDEPGRRHVAACARCRNVLQQLQALTEQAKFLAHAEPPAAMWSQIRAQLEREGLIRPPANSKDKDNGANAATPESLLPRHFPVIPGRR